MILVDKPLALPGSCYFCGSGSRESYVDTRQQVEFHGAMYICNLCGIGIGAMFGMLSADDAEKIKAEKELLSLELYNLKLERDGLQAAVNGLTNARRHSQSGDPRPVAGFSNDSARTSEGSSSGEGVMDAGTIQSPESPDDEGVDDVRSTGTKPEFSLFG